MFEKKKVSYFLKSINRHFWVIYGGLIILLVALIATGWYGYNRLVILSELTERQIALLAEHVETLESNFASTTVALEGNIEQTKISLSDALEQERENVTAIKEKVGGVEQQVGSISGTVTNLEKLSKTDPELLQKYSKVYFLNEHYVPERLAEIEKKYLYVERIPELIHSNVWPQLKNLLEASLSDGETIYISSAYRSFDEQESLKDIYTVVYGEGQANTFSADQGYSEHQLGTTVDFITTGLGGQLNGFDTTSAYIWLLSNAYKYGFTMSYPKGNDYYVFEPWHWRYVGVELATDLYNAGKHFYDMEQREIDEYLVNLFE